MTQHAPNFVLTTKTASTRVFVCTDAILHIGQWVLNECTPPMVVVCSDTTVADLHADRLMEGLVSAGLTCELITFPPGDASKSLAQLDRILESLGKWRVARDGMLIALGGGVVSDLTGFAAATWMRGIAYANCPTTLEADVDASLGGKTGINHTAGKNMIGAFHHPRFVAVDPTCLQSLPQRDIAAGIAESIKHALICDAPFLDWHEQNVASIQAVNTGIMSDLIERNLKIKANIVERDEHENGVRAGLNFGHTLGHAIEKHSNFQLRHGEAVAIGMHAAAHISMQLGLLSANDVSRICAILQSFNLPVQMDSKLNPTTIIETTLGDKKVKDGKRQWVLLEGIGKFVIRDDVANAIIEQAVAAIASNTTQ